jgi:hypothetical protein
LDVIIGHHCVVKTSVILEAWLSLRRIIRQHDVVRDRAAVKMTVTLPSFLNRQRTVKHAMVTPAGHFATGQAAVRADDLLASLWPDASIQLRAAARPSKK